MSVGGGGDSHAVEKHKSRQVHECRGVYTHAVEVHECMGGTLMQLECTSTGHYFTVEMSNSVGAFLHSVLKGKFMAPFLRQVHETS